MLERRYCRCGHKASSELSCNRQSQRMWPFDRIVLRGKSRVNVSD